MEIKTEADSNDITETVNPLHDMPCTGTSGFLSHYIFNIYFPKCVMCLHYVFLMTSQVLVYLGFYDAVICAFISPPPEFALFSYCCSFLYTNTVIITVIDECKHSLTVTLHLHIYMCNFCECYGVDMQAVYLR